VRDTTSFEGEDGLLYVLTVQKELCSSVLRRRRN